MELFTYVFGKNKHFGEKIFFRVKRSIFSEKTVILNSIQKMKRNNKIRRIYMSFKKIIIESYFLTEVGSTQVLKYNGPSVVLGEYKGCVPFSEIGKTWAI